MKFNDVAGGQGLVQDAYFKVGLDATTGPVAYPIADCTRNANSALDNIAAIAIASDGRWQFDDTNYTDLPIATTDLVVNQQDYEFDPKWLDVTRVEILDSLGNWRLLKPFDQEDLKRGVRNSYESYLIPGDVSLTDYLKVAGQPILYDKLAGSIFLYPKPNYSGTASLKVYFQRKMQYFSTTDTTVEAGFMSNLHEYISICMAYEYACLKQLPQMNSLFQKKKEFEGKNGKIATAFARRMKDETPRIRNNTRVKV